MAGSVGANIRGITIKLGGDSSELVKSFKEVNTAAKKTSDSLKDIDKLLKLNPGNVTLLKQKQDLLNRSYKETQQRLTEVKAIRDKLGANNEGGKNQQRIEALNREIVSLEHELDNVKTKASSFSVLGAQMEATGNKIKAVSEKMRQVGATMTTYVTLPLAALGTAAVKAASDYEENLNKVDVAFGKNADSVKEWAKTATEAFGLSESHALEATALFGDMGTSMGLSTKEAAKMSISLAGLAGDLASFKNISQDQAFKALESVFTGETESLKKLGVVMTQTNLEEFASRQNKVYKELSESEKVMLRYEYVMSKTKNAQGDYARTADGTANSIKTFKEEVNNLMVAIGQHLLPVITPIISKLTDMVKAFSKLDPEVQKGIVQAGLAIAVLGPLITAIANVGLAVGTLVGWGGKLVGFFTGTKVAATATTTAVSGAGAAMAKAATASTAAGSAMASGAAAGTSAVTIMGSSIAAVAAAGTAAVAAWGVAGYQIATHWNELKDTFNVVGNYLKSQVNLTVSSVNLLATKGKIAFDNFSNNARTAVTNGMTNVKNAVSTGLSNAKSFIDTFGSNARNQFQTTMSNMQSRTSGAMSSIRTAIQTGMNSAQSNISSAMSSISSSMSSSWNTIQSNVNTVTNTIKTNVSSTWNTLSSNINSTVNDIKSTISTNFNNAMTTVSSKMNSLKSDATSVWSSITSTITSAINSIKTAVSNTTLKFGSVTIPTFSWSGKNDSTKGTTASINVSSKTVNYASAMMGGAILKGATIFGAMGDKLLQAGEVGSEVVVGTNSLMNMIARTARANSNNTAVIAGVSAIYNLLAQYLPETASDKAVVLDNGKLVGALVPAINRQLGLMMG